LRAMFVAALRGTVISSLVAIVGVSSRGQ